MKLSTASPPPKAHHATAPGRAVSRPPRWSMAIAAAVAFSLLAAAGCRGHHDAGDDHDHDDHVGHVIPAHKPRTFPEGIRRLRELNAQIESKVAEGKTGELVADETLPHAIDIANWLPELAGDSDMPERPWSTVNARSALVAADYRAILEASSTAGGPAKRSRLASDAGRTIAELETLVAQADPAWFAMSGVVTAIQPEH